MHEKHKLDLVLCHEEGDECGATFHEPVCRGSARDERSLTLNLPARAAKIFGTERISMLRRAVLHFANAGLFGYAWQTKSKSIAVPLVLIGPNRECAAFWMVCDEALNHVSLTDKPGFQNTLKKTSIADFLVSRWQSHQYKIARQLMRVEIPDRIEDFDPFEIEEMLLTHISPQELRQIVFTFFEETIGFLGSGGFKRTPVDAIFSFSSFRIYAEKCVFADRSQCFFHPGVGIYKDLVIGEDFFASLHCEVPDEDMYRPVGIAAEKSSSYVSMSMH